MASINLNETEVQAAVENRLSLLIRPASFPMNSRSDGAKERIFCTEDLGALNELLSTRQQHPLKQVTSPAGYLGETSYLRESISRVAATTKEPQHWIYDVDRSPVAFAANYRKLDEVTAWMLARDYDGAKCPAQKLPLMMCRFRHKIKSLCIQQCIQLTGDQSRAAGETAPNAVGIFRHLWEARYRKYPWLTSHMWLIGLEING